MPDIVSRAFLFFAEREGFKPPVPVTVHLISNQAHSITLTPLPDYKIKQKSRLLSGIFDLRRVRDSNPRTCYSQQFSRLPQSTTLPTLRGQKYKTGPNWQI